MASRSILIAGLLIISIAGSAQKNYSFQTPVAGMGSLPLWLTGSTVTIKWAGGASGDNVHLKLIDMRDFTVHSGIAGNIENSGNYKWTIPTDIKPGVYEVYIESVKDREHFHQYSGDFAIEPKDYKTKAKPKR